MADENADAPLSDAAPGSDTTTSSEGDYDFGDPGNSAFSEGSIAEIKTAAKPEPATPVAETPPAEPTPETPPAETATPAESAPTPEAAVPAETPPATAVPAAPVTPPAAPPEPTLSQEQMQRAQQLGLTPEYLSQFKDPAVGLLTAENLILRGLQAGRAQAPQAQPEPQPQQPPPVVIQAPAPLDEGAIKKFWMDQGFDETVADAQVQVQKDAHQARQQAYQLAQTNQQLAEFQKQQIAWQSQAYQEIQRLQNVEKAHQESLQKQMLVQAQETVQRDIAAWESAVDPAYKTHLTPEIKQQILEVADALNARETAKGVPFDKLPSIKSLCDQAMYAVLGPKLAAVSREQVREEVKAHQQQAIARPSSGGKPPKVTGLPAAVAFAERFAAEHPELYQSTGPDGRALDDI